MKIVKLQLCVENVVFIEEVNGWKNDFREDSEASFASACAMNEKFIKVDSPLELNLGPSLRAKIQDCINTKNPHIEMFDAALREVEILLMNNCYPQFKTMQQELIPDI